MARIPSSVCNSNNLLSALNIKPTERVVGVRENNLADSNFILTNLMKEILNNDQNKLCLMITHNTLGHYQNISKKLEFDFMKKIQDGSCIVVEPFKSVLNCIENAESFDEKSLNKEALVKSIFLDIKNNVASLKKVQGDKVYLIIDDISHLLDLGVDNKTLIIFINYCANLLSKELDFFLINCHVCNTNDEIISNAINYISDVNIEVSPLKTGISHDVAGVISVKRKQLSNEFLLSENVFHYKAYDKEIKVFAPGESLYYLYK